MRIAMNYPLIIVPAFLGFSTTVLTRTQRWTVHRREDLISSRAGDFHRPQNSVSASHIFRRAADWRWWIFPDFSLILGIVSVQHAVVFAQYVSRYLAYETMQLGNCIFRITPLLVPVNDSVLFVRYNISIYSVAIWDVWVDGSVQT